MVQGSRSPQFAVSRIVAALGMQVLIGLLIADLLFPAALLAQSLPLPTVPGQPGIPQGINPSVGVNPFGPGGFVMPGGPQAPGQAIVTNPNALQPIVPAVTPCPVQTPPDLRPKGGVPNLNDYWPVEPSSLLPSSVEQRMKQEQEERDRQQEKLQAEKEKRALEHLSLIHI